MQIKGAKRSRVSLAAHSQDSEHQLMAEFFPQNIVSVTQHRGQNGPQNGPQTLGSQSDVSDKASKKEEKRIALEFKANQKFEKEKEKSLLLCENQGLKSNKNKKEDNIDDKAKGGKTTVALYSYKTSQQAPHQLRNQRFEMCDALESEKLRKEGDSSAVPTPMYGHGTDRDRNREDPMAQAQAVLSTVDMRNLLSAVNSKVTGGQGHGEGQGVVTGAGIDLGQGLGYPNTPAPSPAPFHPSFPSSLGDGSLPYRSAFTFSQPNSANCLSDLDMLNDEAGLELGLGSAAEGAGVSGSVYSASNHCPISSNSSNSSAYRDQLQLGVISALDGGEGEGGRTRAMSICIPSHSEGAEDREGDGSGDGGDGILQATGCPSDQPIDVAFDEIDTFDQYLNLP
jgi:hypothetical protein